MKRKLEKNLSEALSLSRKLGMSALSDDQKLLVREHRNKVSRAWRSAEKGKNILKRYQQSEIGRTAYKRANKKRFEQNKEKVYEYLAKYRDTPERRLIAAQRSKEWRLKQEAIKKGYYDILYDNEFFSENETNMEHTQ